jgi:lipid-A-disaccharide synthase
MKKKLLVIAGEESGDNHASKLIKELKKNGRVEIFSIGGSRMASVSDHFFEDILSRSAVGFTEVIKVIPYFIGLKNRIIKNFISPGAPEKVDGVILVDYPGFNVRLAKIISGYDTPVFYYITPQVWAWARRRARELAEICRVLFCVFEFEVPLFRAHGGDAHFVSHPILEDLSGAALNKSISSKENRTGKKTIAILPGSRKKELIRHLPVIRQALKDLDCIPVIARPRSLGNEIYEKLYPGAEITEDVYGLLSDADLAVVSSGTAVLETTVIGTPFLVIYKVSGLSYFIARKLAEKSFLEKGFVSMVNILGGERIVPELVQKRFNAAALRSEVESLLTDRGKIRLMKEKLEEIRVKIGTPGSSERAARIIEEELVL